MPIYEYVCDDCGFGFERLQSFHDEPLNTCPECGGSVRRVITSVGVIFKGSGWYITDSRRQIAASSAKPSDKGAATTGNGAEKTEKAAAATDAGADTPSKPAPKEPSTTTEKTSA
jgi:putative FmdB family regulatory protein